MKMQYVIHSYVYISALSPENRTCFVFVASDEPFISTEEMGPLTWSGFSTHGGTFSEYRPVDIPLPASQCLVKRPLAF